MVLKRGVGFGLDRQGDVVVIPDDGVVLIQYDTGFGGDVFCPYRPVQSALVEDFFNTFFHRCLILFL